MRKRTWPSSLSGRCVGLGKNEDVGGGRSPQEGAESSHGSGGYQEAGVRVD